VAALRPPQEVYTPRVSTPETASPRAVTLLRHRVAFYQTDAMGILHHANYLHLLEMARVAWMDEHDEPYRNWVALGLHFAVTRADVQYRRAVRFDDFVETRVWLEWVRGASLAMAYELSCEGELVATARTEHAMVSIDGKPTRIPAERRARLEQKSPALGRP
jgi:acyl-CoA thioester hydrolase